MNMKNHDLSPLRGVLGKEGEVTFLDRLMGELTKYDVRVPKRSVDGDGNTIYEFSFPGAEKENITVKLNVVEHKLVVSHNGSVHSGNETTDETVTITIPVSPYLNSDGIHAHYIEGLLRVTISAVSAEGKDPVLVTIDVE